MISISETNAKLEGLYYELRARTGKAEALLNQQGESLLQTQQLAGEMMETKQSKADFDQRERTLLGQMMRVEKALDKGATQISLIENFVDLYFPLRILVMVREAMVPLLNKRQVSEFEKFEAEKFKEIN